MVPVASRNKLDKAINRTYDLNNLDTVKTAFINGLPNVFISYKQSLKRFTQNYDKFVIAFDTRLSKENFSFENKK